MAGASAWAASPTFNQFFDWEVPDVYPTAPSNVTPVPLLTDANAASVGSYLATRPAGSQLAVKVLTPLNTAVSVFNQYKINYVFADFEGPDALSQTSNLINQVRATNSKQALIGEYNLYPINKDKTQPTNSHHLNLNHFNGKSFFEVPVNMANENLYPGSPTFRNPASNDSNAPNIRSALFTLPIERMSMVTANIKNAGHIPYVTRFNNWGNDALDTDGISANGYRFVPGAPLANNPLIDTTDQMLSRNDFRALTLHYRMRGANALHLFQSGVEGYSKTDMQTDANAGWNLPAALGVLESKAAKPATLDTSINLVGDGVKTSEETGVIWSGAYTTDKLIVLLSNLDGATHTVQFSGKIGPHKIMQMIPVADGSHRLLQFYHDGAYWKLGSDSSIFDDPDLGSRSEVGIPEPSTVVAVVALAASGLTLRRRRRAIGV